MAHSDHSLTNLLCLIILIITNLSLNYILNTLLFKIRPFIHPPTSSTKREESAMKFAESVKILDQSLVSPPPLSSGEVRSSLPLTFFDMFWLNYSPVERLFFYQFPYSADHFLDFHLPIFKSALSVALSVFYPLAATIRRRQPDGHFEIATTDSDSVTLTVSEYEGAAFDFLEISGDHSRPVEKLLPLVPRLPMSPEEQPLLSVQVTLFPNYGLCLAIAVHHAACDGFSSMQFVKLWSAAVAAGLRPDGSSPQPPAPVIDRTVIPDPRNLYLQMEKGVLDERAKEKKVTSGIAGSVFATTFTLSAPEIGRLKKQMQVKAAEQGMRSFHCSSFVISLAYSWICLLKTRRITDGDGAAHVVFAVDWRRRIRPEIPANYFGNCISGCFAKWDAEELLAKDGILVACAAIGKAIDDLGDDAHESMDGLVDRIGKVVPWRPLTVSGSPKMGVYETDFGWGKPRKVEVISTRETGAVALAESRDGEGGIEIGVILPEEDLKAFAKHFAAGRDW
ncbi:phenolic glucoside malonyltransferase 2-like [Dendrobium catenatum]|nr:phenolic glucoside malonyltransferase 2-like [Dendrobium catenatum]